MTSNSLDMFIPYLHNHFNPEECMEHRQSNVINFINAGRCIRKGCCLRHSHSGCVTFSGIDEQTGQLLYVTEWIVKYTQLEAKCAVNCKHENMSMECCIYGADKVITNIENQMRDLAKIRHTNLVNYECVQCVKRSDKILVYIAQDFVIGSSIGYLSTKFRWPEENASMIIRNVLDALIFLHSNSFTHGLLCDMAVYIDNSSIIRISDYGLVPYIQGLIGVEEIEKNDLKALGLLVESLLPTPSSIARNFIEKCTSQIALVDLQEHRFLQLDKNNVLIPDNEQKIAKLNVETPKFNEMDSIITYGSRFQCEYDKLCTLGEGGFGIVYHVKNKLDNRHYAIKILKIRGKKLPNTIDKEVKLLSGLDHKNIVRYYTSWIESAPINDSDVKSSSDGSSSDFYSSNDLNEGECEPKMLQLFIQMEYCNGSTLRTLINDGVYIDKDRLWRHFSEIVKGVAYIHGQGIIHRDLKPANIFIGSNDQIKIGDFGLATTLPREYEEQTRLKSSIEINTSLTRNIGTVLYSAPELNDSGYNQKVDLYSLGVILFEMSCAPFSTEMERNSVLNDLRSSSIKMPQNFENNSKYQRNVKLIQRLLNHNPDDRPMADELLKSDLLSPAELKTNELIIRKTISHPENNQYKNVVAPFLERDESIPNLIYNHVPGHQKTVDYVKSKIVNLFRKHGAIEVFTPLLTPCSKLNAIHPNSMRLITSNGNNVFLPYDLRIPFAQHIVVSGINSIRRYSIDRVYREQKFFNFHPKQLIECAFDIVTPNPGNLLVDAELISIAHDITNELPTLRDINISIRINHTTLLRSILLYFAIPEVKHDKVASYLLDYIDGKKDKSEIKQILNEMVQDLKKSLMLFKLLTTEYCLDGSTSERPILFNLINGFGPAAKAAVRDIQTTIRLARDLGVNCSINLLPSLLVGYKRTKFDGIVWQMLAKHKFELQREFYVLAVGERYDTLLSKFQKAIHSIEKEISGAGFSFLLKNLVHVYATSLSVRGDDIEWTPSHVLVCVLGTHPPPEVVTEILRCLWTAGICSAFIEANTLKKAYDMSKQQGARHLVVLNEDGKLKLNTFLNQDTHQCRDVQRSKLINTIIEMMKVDELNFQVINNNLKKKVFVLQQEKCKLKKSLTKKRKSKHTFKTYIPDYE